MYLYICTNERHKCCILSMQQSEMLFVADIDDTRSDLDSFIKTRR